MELLIIILVLAIFHYGRLKRIEAKLETGREKNANSHYVRRVSARLTTAVLRASTARSATSPTRRSAILGARS